MKFSQLAAVALAMFAVALLPGCTGRSARGAEKTAETPSIEAAAFDADSAYAAVKAQVDMGPRVPGTESHARCGAWLVSELRRHGADTVVIQRGAMEGGDGRQVDIMNITGRYNPEARERVLLVAHWDTRPVADAETDARLHNTPIPGANDGASGVGVLLEIARQLGKKRPSVGVDLLMVDAEDGGVSGDDYTGDTSSTWCLGSQYWSANSPYGADNVPRWAIVLDMVGGIGARFNREALSLSQAPALVERVWATARAIGHGPRFAAEVGGPIIDDHLFISRAGIPAIDIVECRSAETGSFPATWHTLSDDMEHIDRASLLAAGQTVLTVIYNEQTSK